MENVEYDIPDVVVVDDFTIVYKSREERDGEFYDSIEEIKTSKDQFLRKLRFFRSQKYEISHMNSILIEEKYPKQIFKEFISTLTTNKISLNDNNYSILLQLCDKYQYPELQKQILKYSLSRPDIQSAIDKVLHDEEINYPKEEVISTHLDICLRNDSMLNFPIQTLIRILNSPKKDLNDHHLLFEFIKKFISSFEKKNNMKIDKNDQENIQILLGTLDYSKMTVDELKELFNSKYFSELFNCRGTKEKMTQFITEIEKQEDKINELIEQIKKQEKMFRNYEEEHRKNQSVIASYESKMKSFEDSMNKKYEEECRKHQSVIESYESRMKSFEDSMNKKYENERKIQQQNYNEQLERIKKIEEKIENKYKQEQESQALKIKKLENKIRPFVENTMTGDIQLNVQPDQTIKSVIRINENLSKLDRTKSKFLLNTNSSPVLGSSSYEEGRNIENLNQETVFTTGSGTYFMHLLLTDTYGKEKELLSQAVTTKGAVFRYDFTGRVESVTLPAGRYKLEVWGAEGGKNKDFMNHSGKGGYSVGTLTLKETTKLYIHVGECPNSINGGWNGGGSGSTYSIYTPAGGGGSTDISLYGEEGSTNWNNTNHLYSRIIVAGAGGGSSYDEKYAGWYGGFGGGTSGQISGYGTQDDQGTQTRAGKNKNGSTGQSFGVGGTHTGGGSSGGGSGWYGGGASGVGNWGSGGSGGSGYVYNSTTASNYPSGCKLNSSFYLTDSSTISGNKEIPNPQNSSTETGHSGNGYARITPL